MQETSVRYIFATVVFLLTGCAPITQLVSTCPGLRPYDPQLCRGESFQQIPNFENEALIRRQRGEYW
jgi:hypothetical protein